MECRIEQKLGLRMNRNPSEMGATRRARHPLGLVLCNLIHRTKKGSLNA